MITFEDSACILQHARKKPVLEKTQKEVVEMMKVARCLGVCFTVINI